MRFYNREGELEQLKSISERSESEAQLTVVVGRRRIGKTSLCDYPAFSGKILERYFTEKLVNLKRYSAIGTWWEKGNLNELDIVAVDELNKTVLFAEVKRRKENISKGTLQERAKKLLQNQLKDYSSEFTGFSMEDM